MRHSKSFNDTLSGYQFKKFSLSDFCDYLATTRSDSARDLLGKICDCSDYLVFRNYYTVGERRVVSGFTCHKHLVCPLCAMRRSAKLISAYESKVFHVLLGNPDLKFYFFTRTIRNTSDLLGCYDNLSRADRKFSQLVRNHCRRGGWCSGLVGTLGSVEVKRGRGSGVWHVHRHDVLACDSSFSVTSFEDSFPSYWSDRTDGSYIYDLTPVQKTQDSLLDILMEIFKYCVKLSGLSHRDRLFVYSTLSGRRFVSSRGVFYGVKVPDDLTDSDSLLDLPYIDEVYRFFAKSGYFLESRSRGQSLNTRLDHHALDKPLSSSHFCEVSGELLTKDYVDSWLDSKST